MADNDQQIALLTRAVLDLSSALISTRGVLYRVMNQPTLLLSQSDRDDISKEYQDGSEKIGKTVETVDQLVAIMRAKNG